MKLATIVLFFSLPLSAQSAHYRHHGTVPLNDLAATPGAVDAADTKAVLCSPKFRTGTVRNVPESLKHAVCAAYGVSPANCTGKKVEIDHLISLEIGGSNDQKNLWPQPYAPQPGAKEKDVLEDTLHRLVCAGKLALEDAQSCIAKDWVACSGRIQGIE
jgi:hypothetical protein